MKALSGHHSRRLCTICALVACIVNLAGAVPYPVVDTSQVKCYDNMRSLASCTSTTFPGQDASITFRGSNYTIRSPKVVEDLVTGLTWQRGADTNDDGVVTSSDKLTYDQALLRPAALNAQNWGNYSDWRLPSIKELYSLISFAGMDPSPTSPSSVTLVPFINRAYFNFTYGNPTVDPNERVIDSQHISATRYAALSTKVFGVNFADGRIKGYDLQGKVGSAMKFYVLCVRGNPTYGVNSFVEAGISTSRTIRDLATGLMWDKEDTGGAMNWQAALALAKARNQAKYKGYSDWRLPNAKELQSIVNYTRAPDISGSPGPAISPLFSCTSLKNERNQTDWGYYWTSTTHASQDGNGPAAVYIAFGRAMGYMNRNWVDVHGAGAQRSDPKNGDPKSFPIGRGPQGDAIHILNYVRLVRTDPTIV